MTATMFVLVLVSPDGDMTTTIHPTRKDAEAALRAIARREWATWGEESESPVEIFDCSEFLGLVRGPGYRLAQIGEADICTGQGVGQPADTTATA
jgi:hypothetical protein